ncbi:SAM-dependent methyltransferase [Streptomyces sp. NPDC093097]|uniref:SAM-dependent methyltransferase n=1 Tax=Streptomyces sp. NPDC093097 TaxID=3366027 RepID=UPI003809F016
MPSLPVTGRARPLPTGDVAGSYPAAASPGQRIKLAKKLQYRAVVDGKVAERCRCRRTGGDAAPAADRTARGSAARRPRLRRPARRQDELPADREAADRTLAALPRAATLTRQNRAFMHRAARHRAAEAGVRQFLDIGTGIPTSPDLHESVQSDGS